MRGISEEMIEKSMYAMSLYTLAKTKDRMVCMHCGKPIILCDRCYGPTWQIIITCIGDGFVHGEKGHFHHCSGTANTRNCKETLKTLNTLLPDGAFLIRLISSSSILNSVLDRFTALNDFLLP